MRLHAPAKVNWTLEVLGRPDSYRGYHEVRTVMQTVDLCDSLDIEPARELRIEADGPREVSEGDLMLRAAAVLDEGGGRGARIRVRKRIPVAAGLGGGSADAAAVLRGLNEMWGLGLSVGRLAEVGAGLGSDVPFFAYGGTALAEGRGERVTPLPDVSPTWLVLLAPPLQMAEKTGRMYGSLATADFTDGSRTEALVKGIRAGRPVGEGGLCNAFERVAYEAFEGLDGYRDALLAAGARQVHLAGSGPALFALGPDEEGARAVYGRLRLPGGQAFVARTLTAAAALRGEE